jgi:sigma54-dependent transcription regulator
MPFFNLFSTMQLRTQHNPRFRKRAANGICPGESVCIAIMTSESTMAPISGPPMPPHVPNNSSHQLAADIKLAARCTAPVLITAPVDDTLPIVLAIAARNHHESSGPATIVTCDPAAGDDVAAAIAATGRNGAAKGGAILWLKEVHALGSSEQAAVMDLLGGRGGAPGRTPRVIASSTVDLFDRVAAGAFDARLFYRLNTIHIVAPDVEV